jgi:hypothetical protein
MSISRVNYFDRQFLRPQDFSDEQAYHLALHRWHNIAAHIWGILYGLELVKDPAGNLAVQPGLAVDGYGRELVLPYPHTISSKAFDEKGSERLEVWLKYARLESDFASGSFAGCGVEQGPATRSQEYAEVVLQAPDPNLFVESTLNLPERRQPPGVPPNDLLFPPTRLPPDEPAKSWPVYLGMLRRMPGTPPTITIDLSGRPYAGLVGEMVRAPSGRAWMQVGSEVKDDPYRFAIYLPEVERNVAKTTSTPFPTELTPRLGVTEDGKIELRGDTTLEGNLTVEGGAIEFGVGPALARPRPWSISHVQGLEPSNNGTSSNFHQLRIEMGTPSGSAPKGRNKVSIGVFSAKENKFVPCLTVDDECVVTVHGNLHVQGLLDAANTSGKSAISAEARAGTAGMMMMSLAQKLNSTTIAGLNLEREIRTAAAELEPVAVTAAVAPPATDLQPRLDDAMRDVIKVLNENALLPRFMTLLEQDTPIAEHTAPSADAQPPAPPAEAPTTESQPVAPTSTVDTPAAETSSAAPQKPKAKPRKRKPK